MARVCTVDAATVPDMPYLHSVADAKHGDAQLEDGLIKCRSIWRIHRVRPPRNDDAPVVDVGFVASKE